MPVTVTGFKELPNFGERFVEAENEKAARKMALLNSQAMASETAATNVTATDLLRMMNVADNTKAFNVIVKGDVLGSVTSVVDSLKLIDTKGEITLNVIATGVGDVTENDVYLAAGDGTVIYGFNISVPTNIAKLAARNGVDIRIFKVIYRLLDDAKHSMEQLLDKEVVETEVGEMKLKGVFRTEKTYVIAGGEMLKGRVEPGDVARATRGKEVLGEAAVESIEKEHVETKELVEKEVGGLKLNTERKLALEVGDRLVFVKREIKQKTL